MSTSTDMTGTALVPSAIMAHYAAQLTAVGWIAAAPATSERVAAQFFEATDESGAAWEGVMTVVGNANKITASLSMHLRGKP